MPLTPESIDGDVLIKVRCNFKIKKELKDWIFAYAKSNSTTVTAVFEAYIADLKKRVEEYENEEVAEQI